MLVQSHGNDILLLPALPAAWPTGEVRGLRVRGACRVDMAWSEGALQHATLTAQIPGERRVTLSGQNTVVMLEAHRPVRLAGPRLKL
jgi:alpha-L-fucosidase 2